MRRSRPTAPFPVIGTSYFLEGPPRPSTEVEWYGLLAPPASRRLSQYKAAP